MMDYFYTLTTSVVQNLTFVGSMCYLTGTSLKKCFCSWKGFFLNILSVIIMLFIQANNNNSYIALTLFPAMLQYFIVTKILSRASIEQCLSAVMCTYVFQFLFQVPALLATILLFPNFNILETSIETLIIMLFSLFITVFLYYFFPVQKLHLFLSKNIKVVYAGLLVVFLFILAFSGHVDDLKVPDLVAQITTLILLLFVFTLFVLNLFQTQNQKQALKYYQSYLPVLNEMISSVRKSQHNYNNMIQSISALPKANHDYDTLVKTLETFAVHSQKENIPSKLLSLENKLLVALLYCKYESAKDNDIDISFQINNLTYSSSANEFEIVDLTGILLDNALEASQPGDTIFVEIGEPSGSFCITVKNPGPKATQDFIKQIFQENFTTKTNEPERHGLGLSHLKAVVHKHHGRIEVENERIETENNVLYLVLKIML